MSLLFSLSSLMLVAGIVIDSTAIPDRQKNASAAVMPFEKTTYTETVDCGSVSQLDIFRRARLFVLQSTPDDKLLLNDKETGDLVSNGMASVTLPRTESFAGGVYSVSYVLTIECANRKYRSTISHIEIIQIGNARSIPIDTFKLQSEKDTKLFQIELETKLKARLEDLKIYLKEFKPF
jgi:hypothetical protein